MSGRWKKVTRDYPPAVDWDMVKGVIEGEVESFQRVTIAGEERQVVAMKGLTEREGRFSVWVSAGLRDLLTVAVGDKVRINCLGFVKNERTGRKFRAFEVEKWVVDETIACEEVRF